MSSEVWDEAVKFWRGRGSPNNPGRPRLASEAIRENNYRDPSTGKYAFSDGLKMWHERVVDYFLLNPNSTLRKAAEAFDVSPGWMGQLCGSDAFKEYYHARMVEHQSLVSATVVSKMQGVAVKALDKMAEKLEKNELPMDEVREAASMAVKALGYGSSGHGGVRVNVNTGGGNTQLAVVGVAPEVLARARREQALLREVNTKEIPPTDNEYMRVTASLEINPEDVDDAIVLSGNSVTETE